MKRRISVRARLLLALTLLAVATLTIGAIAWVGLTNGADRLDRLHSGTLTEVDRALTLSRQAADLATLAPYLLTLDSTYRISKVGEQATTLVDAITSGLPQGARLRDQMQRTRQAIKQVVRETSLSAGLRDATLRVNAELARAERRFAARSARLDTPLSERQNWLALQRQVAALLGAGRAENLIGVGEFHREYLALSSKNTSATTAEITAQQDRLSDIAIGPDGLFELRRLELASQLRAEAALVRIREGAAAATAYAVAVTNDAQNTIAIERNRATTAIGFTKSMILVVGLCSAILALVAALYVSGYVTANLRAISNAMMRLASGDHQTRLPRGEGSGDEIGKLLHAFRVFRANALRLDRSSRQMARRTALFDNMMAGISDGVAILSDHGTVLTANQRMSEVLRVGQDQLSGRPCLRDVIATAGWTTTVGPSGYADLCLGPHHYAELRESALPGGQSVVLVSDATERRQVEKRLQQIQRIEALGKVSGEVAHDFGNILSTISGSLHLMETALPERQSELRQMVVSAVELGTSLTQRLLSFARRQQLEPETVELNALVEGMGDLVGFALSDEVELELCLHPTALWVRVDPGQMESAILNLCLNAGQAITGTGRVSVTVDVHDGLARVIVTDDGVGMSQDVLSHAMEPFFTARADGTGTGLGLAMVYGFIGQSGGDVHIDSNPGQGTSVSLSLPLQAQPAEDAQNLQIPQFENVLLAEDDSADMACAYDLLKGAANNVAAFDDADQALDNIAQACPDLILTDLNLHGRIEGWRLAQAVLSTSKTSLAIVVSGHLPDATPLTPRYGNRLAVLAKPLTAQNLAQAFETLTTNLGNIDDTATKSGSVRL
ncbi:MAG: ATP-binding protein [Ruegeria sp.]|nr:ATP-binding protein [Ruegeria sp.]